MKLLWSSLQITSGAANSALLSVDSLCQAANNLKNEMQLFRGFGIRRGVLNYDFAVTGDNIQAVVEIMRQ